jgi:GNAT superfamily N-acetyltransferase
MINIQKAAISDAHVILEFIKKLAIYEKLEHEVTADIESIQNSFFGTNPRVFCLLAYWNSVPVGFAVYFYNYSTFLAKHGLYLEDLFIDPNYRSKGLGKALLKALIQIAKDENLGRVEWSVLDWNTPAIDFYKTLRARAMDEWTVFRITEEDFC